MQLYVIEVRYVRSQRSCHAKIYDNGVQKCRLDEIYALVVAECDGTYYKFNRTAQHFYRVLGDEHCKEFMDELSRGDHNEEVISSD